ncbi:TetR/AcrR family transcriptional regulator, partial [Streptomyces lydicus]
MTRTPGIGRSGLSRDRILVAALAIADSEGIGAVTMRRVAGRLEVDPMALYRYVENKDALLAGVIEVFWREVELPVHNSRDWTGPLRRYACGLRAMVKAHPKLVPLLLGRPALPQPTLLASSILLANMEQAGITASRATQILRTTLVLALNDAVTDLTYRSLQLGEDPKSTPDDAWIAVAQSLPATAPPELVRAAYALSVYDPEADFEFVLDL